MKKMLMCLMLLAFLQSNGQESQNWKGKVDSTDSALIVNSAKAAKEMRPSDTGMIKILNSLGGGSKAITFNLPLPSFYRKITSVRNINKKNSKKQKRATKKPPSLRFLAYDTVADDVKGGSFPKYDAAVVDGRIYDPIHINKYDTVRVLVIVCDTSKLIQTVGWETGNYYLNGGMLLKGRNVPGVYWSFVYSVRVEDRWNYYYYPGVSAPSYWKPIKYLTEDKKPIPSSWVVLIEKQL